MAETTLPDDGWPATVQHLQGAPSPEKARSGKPVSDAHELAAALHEVSNALTVIVGWIERARSESGSPSEVERALDVAATRATAARAIVRRAIGAEVAEDLPRAVAAAARDAAMGLEPEARRAGVQIETTLDPNAERFTIAHASRVIQILTNLLLNAIAFSPRGSVVAIDVRARAGGRGVVFGITDQGPGIPPERRRNLFSAGLSTRPNGAGIGLSHAFALARSCGGELSLAESLCGARFELCWPILEEAVPPSRAEHAPPRSRSRLDGSRILVLEDDDAVIDLLDTVLTARGAEVVSARSRAELAQALSQGPFDVALFDISPITEDLQGAIAMVRAASKELRVVLISGSAIFMPSLPPEWVSAWVRKPFEISELLHVLEAKSA